MTVISSDISFLEKPKLLLIGGQWQPALNGRTIETINPATGDVLTSIANGDEADIDRAVAAARKAFEGGWSSWTPYQRQRLLIRINDLVEANFDELAAIETLDMGVPTGRVRNFKAGLSQMILFFASQTGAATTETRSNSIGPDFTTLMFKAPIGVVGGIIPWNAPLMSMWWVFGPTLATGCTAVIKPAEDASLTVLRMAELLVEAGVPDGVINVVTGLGGTAGAALAAHPDVDRISFTGSTQTGRKILEASAGNVKRVQLELGGKSPDIIFADADLDIAIPGAAMGVFGNSGQTCTAGSRLFVEREIADEVVRRLVEFSEALKVGNGNDETVQMGPIISEKQLASVQSYIEIGRQEGAVLACGGNRMGGDLANGYFIEPTVFSGVNNKMRIAQEEIFGPVISVIPFDDADEALRLANDTPYGLAGGIWTTSLATALTMVKGVRAGTLWVNNYGMLDPAVGFGGTKMSGYGWKGGREHVDSFLYQKAAYVRI
jgi:aldehyde dehydrogenase (NAD+)